MGTETKHVEQMVVELDSSQMAAAMAAAEHLKGVPPDKRIDPSVWQDCLKIAREVRDEVRKRRLALGMPARGEIKSWDAPQKNGEPVGGLNIDLATLIPPSVEDLARRRYLLAVNRIASGKVDDPRYSIEDLADIADVMGAGSMNIVPMDQFVQSRQPKQG